MKFLSILQDFVPHRGCCPKNLRTDRGSKVSAEVGDSYPMRVEVFICLEGNRKGGGVGEIGENPELGEKRNGPSEEIMAKKVYRWMNSILFFEIVNALPVIGQ